MGRVCDGLKRKAGEKTVSFKRVAVTVRSSKSTTGGKRESSVGGEQFHDIVGEPLSDGMGEDEGEAG